MPPELEVRGSGFRRARASEFFYPELPMPPCWSLICL